MAKFEVGLYSVRYISAYVEVDAESRDEAVEKAYDMVDNGEVRWDDDGRSDDVDVEYVNPMEE